MTTLTSRKISRGQYTTSVWVGYDLNKHGAIAFHLTNSYEGHWNITNTSGLQVGRFETKADCLMALSECSKHEIADMDSKQ